MDTVLTILYLILILGVLIFVHEFGHFIVAKRVGVYVNEFALGMGPRIFSFKRKNDPTVYSLRLFPIGGFCAMAGEAFEDQKGLKKSQFMCNKTKKERILILVAGVTMNILTAIFILFLQAAIYGAPEQKAIISNVLDGYPAKDVGVEVGDQIIKVNGYKIHTWDKLNVVLSLKNETNIYNIVVKKTDGTTKEYVLNAKIEKDEKGNEYPRIGIEKNSKIERGVFASLKYAFVKLGSLVSTMYMTIVSLITGKIGLKALSGPVGMYTVVGDSAKAGFNSIMYLTAFLSVNLAIINILPFPAFDGGRVLFVIIEAIRGKKVDAKLENIFHTVGFILLMILMLYITIQDIIRLVN